MPFGSFQDVIAALAGASAGFEAFVGERESGWLEFKRDPYRIGKDSADRHRQQLELAKDVSALANREGGFILVGFATTADQTTATDIVTAVTEFELARVDCKQVLDVIRQYVFPPPIDVSCRAWDGDGAGRGIVSVHVPRQDMANKYFLVTEGVDSLGDPIGSHIGLFVWEDHGEARPVHTAVIHRMISDGLRYQTQGPILAVPDHVETVFSEDDADLRLADDLREASIDSSYLFIQSWPESPLDVDDILNRWSPNGFYRRFVDPSQLRPSGFNLDFGSNAEMIPGGILRKSISSNLSLSCEMNGLATLIVGRRYLCWAEESRGQPNTANPLALVEFVSEFCRFVHLSVLPYSHADEPTARYRTGIERLASSPLSLPRGELKSFADPAPPPAGRDSVRAQLGRGFADPAGAAYEVLRALYRGYGIGGDEIPYADPQRGEVDFERLASL